ncbi:TetR/AcrR family transcriptional regulator [Streptomyces aurantiacus]|uniref:TetR/AcrR family transcriptional regulator n=1 Tax=Streptomyces aurantiacus TaxID=47760 RepID=UPI0027D8C938|nr:TetR/AcrR family transcriptional regulator [Streptomyces aurantiacus]
MSTAARLFYSEGIRAVGVDRVIAEAPVTRVTFYRHFPSKEDLVSAYLQAEDQRIRERVHYGVTHASSPEEAMSLLIDGIGEEICAPGFRGCPFINAAAEYPDQRSSVHQAVLTHRSWFHGTLVDALRAGGHPDPGYGADIMVALRDGAMVAGYLGDGRTAAASFGSAARSLIAA